MYVSVSCPLRNEQVRPPILALFECVHSNLTSDDDDLRAANKSTANPLLHLLFFWPLLLQLLCNIIATPVLYVRMTGVTTHEKLVASFYLMLSRCNMYVSVSCHLRNDRVHPPLLALFERVHSNLTSDDDLRAANKSTAIPLLHLLFFRPLLLQLCDIMATPVLYMRMTVVSTTHEKLVASLYQMLSRCNMYVSVSCPLRNERVCPPILVLF
jgi:hypothetical protein